MGLRVHPNPNLSACAWRAPPHTMPRRTPREPLTALLSRPFPRRPDPLFQAAFRALPVSSSGALRLRLRSFAERPQRPPPGSCPALPPPVASHVFWFAAAHELRAGCPLTLLALLGSLCSYVFWYAAAQELLAARGARLAQLVRLHWPRVCAAPPAAEALPRPLRGAAGLRPRAFRVLRLRHLARARRSKRAALAGQTRQQESPALPDRADAEARPPPLHSEPQPASPQQRQARLRQGTRPKTKLPVTLSTLPNVNTPSF